MNVRLRGPHPVLEREIFKIISLSINEAGRQRGRRAGGSYSIPITFEIR